MVNSLDSRTGDTLPPLCIYCTYDVVIRSPSPNSTLIQQIPIFIELDTFLPKHSHLPHALRFTTCVTFILVAYSPFSKKSSNEQIGSHYSVTRYEWCEWVVAKSTSYGAGRTFTESGCDVFVCGDLSARYFSHKIVYCPLVGCNFLYIQIRCEIT